MHPGTVVEVVDVDVVDVVVSRKSVVVVVVVVVEVEPRETFTSSHWQPVHLHL